MKKQINTMGTSFLDLLSGALGAVILLFVIVPKTTITEKEMIAQMQELEFNATQIDSLLKTYNPTEKTMSEAEFLKLTERIKKQLHAEKVMREKISNQLANLQKSNKELRRNNHVLKTDLAKAQAKAKSVTPKATLAKSTSKSRVPSQSTQKTKRVKDTDKSFYFGFDAELSIVIKWDSSATDVDLFLEKDGSFCDEFNRTKSFGKWVRIPKKYKKGPSEVIIQQKLVPGKYKIHAHVSRPRRNGQATVRGFVAMDLGGDKTQKYDFSKKTIKSGPPPYHKRADGSTLIGEINY